MANEPYYRSMETGRSDGGLASATKLGSLKNGPSQLEEIADKATKLDDIAISIEARLERVIEVLRGPSIVDTERSASDRETRGPGALASISDSLDRAQARLNGISGLVSQLEKAVG